MKNALIGIFIVVISILSLNSCKDDLNLVGNYKETPVVIGLLNQLDTVHYVKITRAFIGDGKTSSLDIAQIPDSNYFSNVSATIKEQNGNGVVSRTFTLHDTIIENKDPNGVFYAPYQKVYVFYTNSSNPLLVEKDYVLNVNIDNGRIVVAGKTKLVQDMKFVNSFENFNTSLKFSDNPSSYKNQIIQLSNVGTAVKLNCKIIFNYREFSTFPTVYEDKSILINIGDNELTSGSSVVNFNYDGLSFYNAIKAGITSNAGIVKRRYTSLEIIATGGSSELSNFIDVSQPSSDLAQTKPEYTNLTVTEGFKVIGLFSSRQSIRVLKPATGGTPYIRGLDQKSVYELCNGVITGTLLFCSDHTTDATASPAISYCP